MTVEAIVALDEQGGIGLSDALPWPKNSEDLKWFKDITMGKVCIVGHNTASTLPPLNGRTLHVMQRGETPEEVIAKYKDLIVIGGRATYMQWLPYIDRFYVSKIKGTYPADTYLKEFAPWLP